MSYKEPTVKEKIEKLEKRLNKFKDTLPETEEKTKKRKKKCHRFIIQ